MRWLVKQERLLYAAFYILLNMAEDINIEGKMIKKSESSLSAWSE